MIARALGAAIVLVLGYGALVQAGVVPAGYRGNTAWLEGYLYEDGQRARVVVAGSSRTRRLAEVAPADWCVLGLEASDATTALAAMARAQRVPALVLVEANATLLRGEVARDLAPLDGPGALLARWLPAAREAYRPVNVLRAALVRPLAALKAEQDPPPEVVQQRLAATLARVGPPPAPPAIEAALDALAWRIAPLEARGAQVVFFDPPAAPAYRASPPERLVRAALARRFPTRRWLPRPADGRYATTDGAHLTAAGAAAYMPELVREAEAVRAP